ncbi:reverse transcriptase domain-containing protein [Tanacetum coccineum]
MFPEERLMSIADQGNEPWISTTARKVCKDVFYWPNIFRDAIRLVHSCNACQRSGNISARNETPQKYIQWVESQAFPTSDARNVVKFLKKLFSRFGMPKALISDRGTYLCNYQMERAMKKYGVVLRFLTVYHLQTNCQVKNTNRAIKRILKKTIGNNQKDWSNKLDDALWAFRTTFKTPLEITPFRLIYGKDELRLDAYESSISYKERTKRWHDKRINPNTEYEKGDKVLLFNPHLRLFPEKLKSRWYGSFTVSRTMRNGSIELSDKEGNEFIVNRQRVKPYKLDTDNFDKDDDIVLENQGGVT